MEGQSLTKAAAQLSSLRDYVAVVRRRKWIVAQTAVIVPVVAVVLSMRQDPLYASSAEVLFTRQNLALTLTGTADPAASGDPARFAQTQARLAKVPEVGRRVAQAANIAGYDPAAVLTATTVSPHSNSDFLIFTVHGRDPTVTAKLATVYAREYVKYKRRLDTSSLAKARNKVQTELERLTAQGRNRTDTYDSLVEKRQQIETIEALQTANASLVQPAAGGWQISPRPKRDGILGLGLGLILGLALAFLREALDTRVRSNSEIEEILPLPLLGRLPAPPRHLQAGGGLVMLHAQRSPEAESFRFLRSNFEFHNLEHGARTIMVTSSVSEEGKSTTIANLGAALAAAGHNVTLVDLDLRRPMLGKYLQLRRSQAEGGLAPGEMPLEDVELRLEESGSQGGSLRVLTARQMVHDASAFIASPEFDQLLADLVERSDYVLIDAPPMLLVGDALQLSGKTDAVLVVVRLGVARRPMLAELARALDATPTVKLGYVVTGAQFDYDYHDGYGSYAYAYSPARDRQAGR